MLAKCNFHSDKGLADRPFLIMCALHGGVYVHIVNDDISCLDPSGGQRPKLEGCEGQHMQHRTKLGMLSSCANSKS